jgi:ATP-dependent DNA helicase RecG
MFIRELKQSVTTLHGVGKSAANGYEALSIRTLSDLLLLAPRAWEDRSTVMPLGKIREQPDGTYANTFVEVVSHSFFGGRKAGKRTLKIIVRDISGEGDGRLSLLCFGRNFLEKTLRVGRRYYLYGAVTRHMTELQSSQFEMTPLPDDGSDPPNFGEILPIYPLAGALSQRIIRRDIRAVLAANRFDDELPQYLMDKYQLIDTDSAIRTWHYPHATADITAARRTLAFTELMYLQLVARRRTFSSPGDVRTVSERIVLAAKALEETFVASLPFSLTADQRTVLQEIKRDLDAPVPMNRLLQGDVGSGKTLVAWISALHVIAGGQQVAFMAPTELLARQHAEHAAQLLEPLGVRIAFLTGSVKTKERKLLLEALAKGNIDILIGTHALFSKEVEFKSLRYIIIDEQHRFGVEQRMAMLNKGRTPDVLLMTATPIPRTLALTVFGDLNVSTIHTMPAGRLPIITHLVADKSRQRMYQAVGVEFERGHQAYFVYPRIDDSGESDLRDVTNMYEYLSETIYPGVPSALIHSKLPEEEKVDILLRFRTGQLRYLVSTSVVEVGIDIPNATCMVIEHADRFGLSALHQLRGRVGRSDIQSYCFLVYGDDLSDDAKLRLKVMRESTDGFHIAEQDLLIRGPGEITGTKQSGFLRLHFASLTEDLPMIQAARTEADRILADDPGFILASNSVIRRVFAQAPPFDEETTEVS